MVYTVCWIFSSAHSILAVGYVVRVVGARYSSRSIYLHTAAVQCGLMLFKAGGLLSLGPTLPPPLWLK